MQIQAISSGTGLYGTTALTNSGSGSSGQTSAASTAASSAGTQASSSASQSSASALSDSYYDVMDTNKDGYVSFLERLIYTLTHPGTVTETQAATEAAGVPESLAGSASVYNRQGGVSSDASQSRTSIDILA